MFWPFRRKRPVVDIRAGGWQWRPGMLAVCLTNSTIYQFKRGDVHRVAKVTDGINHEGIRAFWLWFDDRPGEGWASHAFRPAEHEQSGDEIEAGLIAKIKRSAKRGAPVGEPVA